LRLHQLAGHLVHETINLIRVLSVKEGNVMMQSMPLPDLHKDASEQVEVFLEGIGPRCHGLYWSG
jgi:hypothetical protein